jgi:predicted TIM-barrel fold metal-dependent hydrolase
MTLQRGSQEWLDQVVEDVIDPNRPIIDPHHHLWHRPNLSTYLLDDLWADTESGHRIEKTVFIECRAGYREDGPEHLRVVGETEFVAKIAQVSQHGGDGKAVVAAIVSHADLTRGDVLDEVLDAHAVAGKGLFRGIRHGGAYDPEPEALSIRRFAIAGLYDRDHFRAGLRMLGRRGLSYDTWHYHHQNRAFLELARAVPDTTLVLDHFGTPLGVGRFADQREAIFAQWKLDIAELARCPNVFAKLGGLAMPDNGFGWDQRDRPASSDELVAAQRRYYQHVIECFGPSRCMFESNFPVDKRSISYRVLWNALKKIASEYSAAEQHAMFYETAQRVYRLA